MASGNQSKVRGLWQRRSWLVVTEPCNCHLQTLRRCPSWTGRAQQQSALSEDGRKSVGWQHEDGKWYCYTSLTNLKWKQRCRFWEIQKLQQNKLSLLVKWIVTWTFGNGSAIIGQLLLAMWRAFINNKTVLLKRLRCATMLFTPYPICGHWWAVQLPRTIRPK